MMQTILVTGACGNIGQNVLSALANKDCKIKVLDLGNPVNKKVAESYPDIEFCWGDITDAAAVQMALQGVNTVLHLIGIIPPMSESHPELARKVNVQGMNVLIDAMQKSDTAKRIVFTSTFAVLGIGDGTNKIHTADMPYKVSDVYSETKVDCEKALMASNLDWTILRLSAIPNVDPSAHNLKDMALSMRIGPKDFIEFCHARDVALALVSAGTLPFEKVKHQIFMIGGGDSCRFNGHEFSTKLFSAAGVGQIPAKYYSHKPKFYAGWVDSETSNEILDYQRTSLDDFCQEFHQLLGKPKYIAAKIFSPLILLALVLMTRKMVNEE
ncbi:MAG: NAD(P)-dependent oxidoreductase [Lentisphaeria bacterium]|nr:NAD(P)-dependent oxidoreductase [Lentisphaeria bacterium]